MHWSKAPTNGIDFMGARSHSATVVGHRIFVFGGSDRDENFNDLLIFDTETLYWSKPETHGQKGSIPTPQRAHSATLVGTRILVFGGGDGSNYFNDLYSLDTKTLTWSKPITSGQCPGPRRAHSANLVGSKLWIFGGGNGNKALNELYCLDTMTMTWSQITPGGTPPIGRGYHISEVIDGKIAIIGGSDGAECFSDFHLYSPSKNTWKKVPIKGPTPMLSHASVIVGRNIVVFGGHNASDYINSLQTFDLGRRKWEDRQTSGTAPEPRGYHCCCFVNHRMFVIGGYDGTQCFKDVYMLDLGEFAANELVRKKMTLQGLTPPVTTPPPSQGHPTSPLASSQPLPSSITSPLSKSARPAAPRIASFGVKSSSAANITTSGASSSSSPANKLSPNQV
ncbi:hypothetical protein SAMD00019534_081370 [Acytostelium subglobosum LB1]|uniref:hypothetical protein n=1 Tax=Acytostelium subglobosum LB1 TaxID=1410327 RepID=UPI0006451BF3|nr:hypothetical protein SAMD00019534_081370 [Acytostelium subglobosum LB1]GAM24962.1 hypothetical protein SAMD00019534_081370 [Acytostelium subglobosum LB1]|eukprot:XP_012752051.1 hypothetical protein SAMD00019534_081370 [Acytostelium subglobosum LB1]